MKPNILLCHNLMFIKMSTNNTFIKTDKVLYMAASINGQLFHDNICEYEDIIAEYTHAQPVDSFLTLKQVYDK